MAAGPLPLATNSGLGDGRPHSPTPTPKMEGEEGADDWGSLDTGGLLWEQQEGWEAPSIDSPSSQQAPATSGRSGWGLAADYQRWRDGGKEMVVMHVR